MLEHAIAAEGLRKSCGSVHALRGIDLAVPTGTILGLLGPNGVGKATAVRVLTTLLHPAGGRANVAGHDVVHEPDAVRAIWTCRREGQDRGRSRAGPQRPPDDLLETGGDDPERRRQRRRVDDRVVRLHVGEQRDHHRAQRRQVAIGPDDLDGHVALEDARVDAGDVGPGERFRAADVETAPQGRLVADHRHGAGGDVRRRDERVAPDRGQRQANRPRRWRASPRPSPARTP